MLAYIACPYTHADPEVRRQRFEAVSRFAAKLVSEGVMVFSPISHGHPITTAADLPFDWQFWARHSLAMLAVCDQVIVCCLDGWEQSVGVQAELEAARRLGLPIILSDPDDAYEIAP